MGDCTGIDVMVDVRRERGKGSTARGLESYSGRGEEGPVDFSRRDRGRGVEDGCARVERGGCEYKIRERGDFLRDGKGVYRNCL